MDEDEDINEALMADGFESAFIGFGIQFNVELAVYDYSKCVKILMKRDNMDEDEAIDFMDYKVVGSYVGKNTPVFVTF